MSAHTVNAEVSIDEDGQIYVGVEARQRLGLGYNDGVRVTIPNDSGTETFSGYLNAANRIYASRDAYRRLTEAEEERTERVEAIVEPASLTWDDVNGLTDVRWDGHDTLATR